MKQYLPLVGLVLLVSTHVNAQATGPATAPSDGALRVVITGVEGTVQARTAPDQPWKGATVNMELSEGAELRTGIRSAVRFVILPDQVISLDRLGTLQILRANFENGKVMTDLGMKYGRTRYDIDPAGREHDAKIHSPSSVLAIRGTQVNLYDQPPFAPQATSLTGRAQLRDFKKQISFGSPGAGTVKVGQNDNTPADSAKLQTSTDPRGQFSGRTETDNLLQLSLAAYGGSDFSNLGVLSFLDQARAGNFKGSVIGALPIGRQLSFGLFWMGSSFSDLDFSVTSPRGEVVSPMSTSVASSGRYLGGDGAGGNGIADESGFGQESIVWEISYPVGNYIVRAELKSGSTADAQIFVIDDPLVTGQVIGNLSGTLTPGSPVLQGTVTATGQTQPASPSQVQAVAKTTKATKNAPLSISTSSKPQPVQTPLPLRPVKAPVSSRTR